MFGMLIRVSFTGVQCEPGEQVRGEPELINNFLESLLSLSSTYFLGPPAQPSSPLQSLHPSPTPLVPSSTKWKGNSLRLSAPAAKGSAGPPAWKMKEDSKERASPPLSLSPSTSVFVLKAWLPWDLGTAVLTAAGGAVLHSGWQTPEEDKNGKLTTSVVLRFLVFSPACLVLFTSSSLPVAVPSVQVLLLCSVRTKGRCLLTPLGTQTFHTILKATEHVGYYYGLVRPPKNIHVNSIGKCLKKRSANIRTQLNTGLLYEGVQNFGEGVVLKEPSLFTLSFLKLF